MYDSNGKLPDGIIEGNWQVFGSYYSCYEVKVEDVYSFGGKFCYIRFTPNEKNQSSEINQLWFPLLQNNVTLLTLIFVYQFLMLFCVNID